jgi:lysophospholipid acyltransferase (LPLAT)-like uncharacterized protein
MLVSRHRDAEFLARIAYHMGVGCVRGSTNQGAATALRHLVRMSRHNHLAVTPDGPRGPRRQMAPGPVFLASVLGLPLVVLGIGYDRPWRLNTWDRFAIPRYGTRARLIMSPPMAIPSDLDRDGIEEYRQQVEQLINRLTLEAEAWAEAGTSKLEEVAVHHEILRVLEPRRRNIADQGHPASRPIVVTPAA